MATVPSPRADATADSSPLLEDLLMLVEGMEAAVFVIDEQERYLRLKAGRLPLLAPPQEILGRTLAEVMPPALLPPVRAAIARAHAMGEEVLVPYDLMLPRPSAPDGPAELRHFEARLVPRPAGGVLVVAFDVTDRVEVESRRVARERLFQALIERSSDVLYALDRDLVITLWSPGAERALGWSASEAIGKHGMDYIHPEDRGRIVVPPPPGGQVGAAETHHYRARHKNGTWRQLEATVRNLLEDTDIQAVVVNAQDVTEQRRMEAQAAEARKLDSIGRLAGGVAHDFNNLLTVIMGCGEMLQQAIGAGMPPDPVDVEEILSASRRARELTGQLLAFARRQMANPAPVDVDRFLREEVPAMRRLVGGDMSLTVTPADAPRWTRIDPSQLHQVVLNLAVNARDVMPMGGELHLSTERVWIADDDAAQAEGLKPGAYICLRVADQGPGIPPEVRAHLFEPFFTTKERGRGTGMGLATVYGIARQNGGTVRVDSTATGGSAFLVLLPERMPEAPAPHAVPTTPIRRGQQTVLVVEDDPAVASIAARALREGGFRVLLAHDGPAAMALADRTDDLDLLLTDIVMPGMSGPQLSDRLLQDRPELPVIFMSGYPADALISRVGRMPVDLLSKPFSPADLVARVRAALRST